MKTVLPPRIRLDSARPRLVCGESLPRHFHTLPYATIILEGGYEEAGEGGRWQVREGNVLIHAPFSTHRNYSPRGATLVNLALPIYAGGSQCGYVDDPAGLARLAVRNPREASALLAGHWRGISRRSVDMPDVLANLLSMREPPGIAAWSAHIGVSRQTIFRQFFAVYGVGPGRYRVEARARSAWRLIVGGSATLTDIAMAAGYADQAHMQRDVKSLTGHAPGAWRQWAAVQHSFNTLEQTSRHNWQCVTFDPDSAVA